MSGHCHSCVTGLSSGRGPSGDGGDRGAVVGVGSLELSVGAFEPDTTQVGHGGGVQVTAEGQLDSADGDVGGAGEVLIRTPREPVNPGTNR